MAKTMFFKFPHRRFETANCILPIILPVFRFSSASASVLFWFSALSVASAWSLAWSSACEMSALPSRVA